MTEKLHKIWAISPKLSSFYEELFQGFGEAAFPAANGTAEHLLESAEDSALPGLLALKAVAKMFEDGRRSEAVKERLRNLLVSGELTVLGRHKTGEGHFEIIRPPEKFWIGAKIEPELNLVEQDGFRVDDLRVESRSTIRSESQLEETRAAHHQGNAELRADDKHSTALVSSPQRRGRKTFGDEILAAIDHCVSHHHSWWGKSPKDRRSGYYSYLKREFKIGPDTHQGLDTKTIEKYETEYKKRK